MPLVHREFFFPCLWYSRGVDSVIFSRASGTPEVWTLSFFLVPLVLQRCGLCHFFLVPLVLQRCGVDLPSFLLPPFLVPLVLQRCGLCHFFFFRAPGTPPEHQRGRERKAGWSPRSPTLRQPGTLTFLGKVFRCPWYSTGAPEGKEGGLEPRLAHPPTARDFDISGKSFFFGAPGTPPEHQRGRKAGWSPRSPALRRPGDFDMARDFDNFWKSFSVPLVLRQSTREGGRGRVGWARRPRPTKAWIKG